MAIATTAPVDVDTAVAAWGRDLRAAEAVTRLCQRVQHQFAGEQWCPHRIAEAFLCARSAVNA